jgi:uncharacterized protein (TIGR02246 family)
MMESNASFANLFHSSNSGSKIIKTPFLFAVVAGIGATMWLVSGAEAQQRRQTSPTDVAPPREVDAAIRKAAKEFTEAFGRGNAEALAKHFTMNAVYIDENGQRFEGRKSIQQEYETLFANRSDLRLQLEIDSIRLVNATTAIEEGRVALTPQPPGSIRVMSRYTAIHTRQNGDWLMAHVRDTRVVLPPDYGQLEDLDWLVGSWAMVNDAARVEVGGRWVENNHYLARSHSVTTSGKVTSTGLEIIGLDGSTGQITSWTFTSDGGHAVGLWAPHDNGWIVQSVGVMNDGMRTIATNILSRKDKDTLVWKSYDRFAGDATLPDIQEVTLKRQ